MNIVPFSKKTNKDSGYPETASITETSESIHFQAKYFITAGQLVKSLVDAQIVADEETIFEEWLKYLAIFINKVVFNGRKSGIPGIDLELDHHDIRYIVTIKSGPNWGNSSQIGKMKTDFNSAKKTLRTSNSGLIITAVNGCCYGKDNRPDKGNYYKYCGQAFWSFIANEPELYKDLIGPIGHKAKEKNEQFLESYAQMINKFTLEFGSEFVSSNGSIDWEKLVILNSSEA